MIRSLRLSVVAVALGLGACAPQTVISNQRQAVIESWSPSGAVALAEKECAANGRWPYLERQAGNEFWFSCHEREAAVVQRRQEPHAAAAVRRAEELRQTMAAPPAPAQAGVPASVPAPVAPAKAPPPLRAVPEAAPPPGLWVQVGAFRDRAVGERFVAVLRNAHASMVKGRKLVLTDLASARRGVWYLARLGPYPDTRAARRACAAIMARGTACFTVRQR